MMNNEIENWNKDWKPGPYPKTPEERLAAAKKYGLRVEDYDVYPDDGLGYGDYPKLPYASGDYRSGYEDWDIPELKRNFGEPLHVMADCITEDKWDPNAKPRYSYLNMFLTTTGFVGALLIIYIVTLPYPWFQPAMPKQYPFNDLFLEKGGDPKEEKVVKHYTFERGTEDK
ncbi:hypothetical protein C0Q70_10716 [Pomacea canaliculata]|uniref:NADH dehydrogenase [ubiquinone] 1 beta subcomplex subunit 8, mitochondrial n=1 Tax=Pomacea canaliculata TaxID=400727 RepID=A0A2T7P3X9_POMCA|nr:hypothetical protein C0Q70_10716 [Pomacea canaliculata]